MKRIVFTTASLLMLFITNAFAEPAYFIDLEACAMADGNGNFFYTEDTKIVVSLNADETNLTLKCSAKGVPNSTGNPVKYDFDSTGQECEAIGGAISTEDWLENVSTAGNATITCQFHNVPTNLLPSPE